MISRSLPPHPVRDADLTPKISLFRAGREPGTVRCCTAHVRISAATRGAAHSLPCCCYSLLQRGTPATGALGTPTPSSPFRITRPDATRPRTALISFSFVRVHTCEYRSIAFSFCYFSTRLSGTRTPTPTPANPRQALSSRRPRPRPGLRWDVEPAGRSWTGPRTPARTWTPTPRCRRHRQCQLRRPHLPPPVPGP